MAACCCSPSWRADAPAYDDCLLIAPIGGRCSMMELPPCCHNWLSTLLSVRPRPKPSSYYPNAGLSSARWPGSIAAADWPRTGKTSIAKRSLSCALLPSASCSENFVILHELFGQTLRQFSLTYRRATGFWSRTLALSLQLRACSLAIDDLVKGVPQSLQ